MGRLANLESRIVAVEAMAKANRPLSGLGTDVVDAAGGTGRVVNAKAGAGDGGVAVPVNTPFRLLDVSADGEFNVRVVYGTVNGIVPTGMSAGDIPQFVLTNVSGEVGYVYLIVSVDTDYVITDIGIDWSSEVPVDEDFFFNIQIGSWNITDDVMTLAQSISGSQGFKWCGGPLFALS